MSSSLNSSTNSTVSVSAIPNAPTAPKPSTAAAASATTIVSATSTIISSSKESAASTQQTKRTFKASEDIARPKRGKAVPADVWHHIMKFLPEQNDWIHFSQAHPLFVTLDDRSTSAQQWKIYAQQQGFRNVQNKADLQKLYTEINDSIFKYLFKLPVLADYTTYPDSASLVIGEPSNDDEIRREEITDPEKRRERTLEFANEYARILEIRNRIEKIDSFHQKNIALQWAIHDEYKRCMRVDAEAPKTPTSKNRDLIYDKDEFQVNKKVESETNEKESAAKGSDEFDPSARLENNNYMGAANLILSHDDQNFNIDPYSDTDENPIPATPPYNNAFPYAHMLIEPETLGIGGDDLQWDGPVMPFQPIIMDLEKLLLDGTISVDAKIGILKTFEKARVLIEFSDTEFCMILKACVKVGNNDLIDYYLKYFAKGKRMEINLLNQLSDMLIPEEAIQKLSHEQQKNKKIEDFLQIILKYFPNFNLESADPVPHNFEQLKKIVNPIIEAHKQKNSKESTAAATVSASTTAAATSTAAMPVSTSTAASAASANTAAAGSLDEID